MLDSVRQRGTAIEDVDIDKDQNTTDVIFQIECSSKPFVSEYKQMAALNCMTPRTKSNQCSESKDWVLRTGATVYTIGK